MIYARNTMAALKTAAERPQNLLLKAHGGFRLMQWALDTAGKWLESEYALDVHPDAYVLDKPGVITKEDVDNIVEFTYTMPKLAPYKVIVINNMQNTNAASQSAMLKVLEDAAKAVKFILIARGEVLPTIESRCTPVMVYPPVFGEFLDGNADPYCYYAVNGDCEGYEMLVKNEESVDFVHGLVPASFSQKGILAHMGMMNEKQESAWDRESNRELFVNLISEMASRAVGFSLGNAMGEDNGIFECFERFSDKIEESGSLFELTNSFRRSYRNGNITKNALLLFLIGFSSICENVS